MNFTLFSLLCWNLISRLRVLGGEDGLQFSLTTQSIKWISGEAECAKEGKMFARIYSPRLLANATDFLLAEGVREAWTALEKNAQFQLCHYSRTTTEILSHLTWTVGTPNVTTPFLSFHLSQCEWDCFRISTSTTTYDTLRHWLFDTSCSSHYNVLCRKGNQFYTSFNLPILCMQQGDISG